MKADTLIETTVTMVNRSVNQNEWMKYPSTVNALM